MCGRFVQFRSLEELSGYLPIDVSRAEAVPNYNIAPTQQVLAVTRYNDQNHLVNFYWGLVPSWAKDISIRNKMIRVRLFCDMSDNSFDSHYTPHFLPELLDYSKTIPHG